LPHNHEIYQWNNDSQETMLTTLHFAPETALQSSLQVSTHDQTEHYEGCTTDDAANFPPELSGFNTSRYDYLSPAPASRTTIASRAKANREQAVNSMKTVEHIHGTSSFGTV
jgi:hypothetical protein